MTSCDKSLGIASKLRAGRSGDRIHLWARVSKSQDGLWGPNSVLYNGYRGSITEVNRLGR